LEVYSVVEHKGRGYKKPLQQNVTRAIAVKKIKEK
jgi:hypothetical protein